MVRAARGNGFCPQVAESWQTLSLQPIVHAMTVGGLVEASRIRIRAHRRGWIDDLARFVPGCPSSSYSPYDAFVRYMETRHDDDDTARFRVGDAGSSGRPS